MAASGAEVTLKTVAGPTVFPAGTNVTVEGTATQFAGLLDLMMVLDSSGSMGLEEDPEDDFVYRDRADYLAEASKLLAESIPPQGNALGVVDFDSNAQTVADLKPLDTPDHLQDVKNAIDGLGSGGGTDIGDGIDEAAAEFARNGRTDTSKLMLVVSDGVSSSGVSEAETAGNEGYTVSTVALPGADRDHLMEIAAAGNGDFYDVSTGIDDLIDLFTGGSLVGVESVMITDPDGNTYAAALGSVGQFVGQPYAIEEGENVFTALARFADGSQATTELVVTGTSDSDTGVIPLPASGLLLALPLGALGLFRRTSKV